MQEFDFIDISERVRELMVSELEHDILRNAVYFSGRLNKVSQDIYVEILKNTFLKGNDATLARDLKSEIGINKVETRKRPSGEVTLAKVPNSAADTLAQGEFNRYYVRAICRLAVELGHEEVEVYRAKQSKVLRADSQVLIGTRLKAESLLSDLRNSLGIDSALGLMPGPNSGLSVKLAGD